MEATFESILDSIKNLLKRNEILSKTCEENLNKLYEIEQHLQAVHGLCETEQQTDENQGAMTVKNTCTAVAYGGYIKEKTDAAGLADAISKMKIETFPESIQPKGYEIKGYVDEIFAQLELVEKWITKIDEMLGEFGKNQYRLSETERIDLEMLKLEFDGGLEICTGYQKQAAEALKDLNSEVNSYMKRQKKATIAKAGLVALTGAGAGALVGAAMTAVTALKAGGAAVVSTVGAASGASIVGGRYGISCVNWYTSLLVGAAVSVIGLCLVYKRWAATRQFCDELLLMYRNYTDLINESQSISDRLKCIVRN